MSLLSGPRMPPRTGGPPRQLVVLLHGVGANGDDLIALAPAMAAVLPGAVFVAPNAPEPCDMAPFGYQWFSLRDRRPEALLLGVQSVAPLVDAFIDAQLEHCRLTDDRLAEEAQSRPPVYLIPGDADYGHEVRACQTFPGSKARRRRRPRRRRHAADQHQAVVVAAKTPR